MSEAAQVAVLLVAAALVFFLGVVLIHIERRLINRRNAATAQQAQSFEVQVHLWQQRAEEYRRERDACEEEFERERRQYEQRIQEARQVHHDLFAAHAHIQAQLEALRLLQPEDMRSEILRLREQVEGLRRTNETLQDQLTAAQNQCSQLTLDIENLNKKRDTARRALDALQAFQNHQLQEGARWMDQRLDNAEPADRRQELETTIRNTYTIIQRYNDLLRLENDPTQIARYERDIATQTEYIRQHLLAYARITEQPAREIAEIATILNVPLS